MKNTFEKIGIIYNSQIQESYKLAQQISQNLNSFEIFSIDNMKDNINLAIVIGGDGSFLKASRFYSSKNIAVLGFNMGRLGYLAQAKPDEINDVIEKLKNNQFKIEERLMLKANENIALNDIVIKGESCTRTATLDLYINDKLLCSYVADGVIVSTPTGSTAYSLSAGGPIISPILECFLITPICPHTLNTRPIVISKNEKITIKNHENQKLNVSFDGQVDIIMDNEINIEQNKNNAKILILNQPKYKFYDILKEKLHWSLSPKK